ncbi:MAG: toll/interleukin-1 receptor domain-containing protein [bacterium]|nr:toll/interleukin-1 receptor domain-containing protein [bacterium]
MPKTIFISHSTLDDAQIDTIATALEATGHTVWVDHRNGITPNDSNWDKTIRKAIAQADAGVFVMTETALKSDICGSECLLIRELNKPLYVLRLEACQPENIWLYIKQIQFADLVTNFEAGIKSLLGAIEGNTAKNMPTQLLAQFTGRETMRQYLPFLNNPLRGREADVTAIQKMLGGHVTQVIGLGGLGKSRLSAEIALAYPKGAVWHRCSSVSRSYEVVDLLRQHLHLAPEIELPDVLAQIGEIKPLVVIDNGEDVVPYSDIRKDYVALLNQLTAHGVPVLLTSRIAWDELKPRKEYAPKPFDISVASQLVLDFAQSQDIAVTDDQAQELATVARLHPRLIEFAVGQLHETPYKMVIKRLNELTHTDIQAALDEMITKTLHQMREESDFGVVADDLIHNLTWLRGTFPLDVIVAFKPSHITDDDMLIDTLKVLRRYQFIRYDPTTGRYRLAELVREAIGVPKNARLFMIYADFYIARAGQIFRNLPPESWGAHEADLPNITALADELMARMKTGNMAMIERMRWFAKNTMRYASRRLEARAWVWMEAGLESIALLREHRLNRKISRALIKDEATFLNTLGYVWSVMNDYQKALDYYEKALPLYRDNDYHGGESLALTNIGYVLSQMGENHKALDYYEQALTLNFNYGDKQGEATILNNIGTAWMNLGEHRKALDYYEKALPLRREIGDKWGEATVLNNIGRMWSHMGDHHKAIDYLKQSLPLRQLVGDKRGEAVTWHNMAKVYEMLGDMPHALEAAEQAIATTYPHDHNMPFYNETRMRLLGE